jgi:hypothetical protein
LVLVWLILLPIAITAVVGLAIDIITQSNPPGDEVVHAVVVVVVVAACAYPLAWSLLEFKRRAHMGDAEVLVIRLRATLLGPGRRSALSIDDTKVVIYAPNILSKEWVIPKRDVAYVSMDGPSTSPSAVFPRFVKLKTKQGLSPIAVLFFLTPQRIVPLKTTVEDMPFGVKESAEGVWTDGCALDLKRWGNGRSDLLQSGLLCFDTLANAAIHTYGPMENPYDPDGLQIPSDDSSAEILTGPGDFWRHPEPVRRLYK